MPEFVGLRLASLQRSKKIAASKKTLQTPTRRSDEASVTASILSALLLVSPAPLPFAAQPPSLVEPSSDAWAVVHAGQLWVCWTPGPDCFERVVFDNDTGERDDTLDEDTRADELVDTSRTEPELGVDAWQLGFWGPRSLWIEGGEQRWRVLAGQRRARTVDEPAPVRLQRLSPAQCGPKAVVPALIGGRLSWREAPRCALEVSTHSCVTSAGPRVRPATPLRVRAGVELGSARGWSNEDDAALALAIAERRSTSAVEVSVFVEFGFDWQRRARDQRARALISRRGRGLLRKLPTVASGPRAAAEVDALANIVCRGAQP